MSSPEQLALTVDLTAVGYESDTLAEKAYLLAEQLHYQLDKNASPCLYVTADRLALKMPNFSLLFADFSASSWLKRKAEGKKHALVRACKPAKGIKIIDATAGWGKDSAILASFNAEVLMIERNSAMAALLEDALQKQSQEDKQHLNLALIHAKAHTYLNALCPEEYPDVIYIDPMHPERTKSALVKKEMQALQRIIGPDQDALELIQCARSHAKQRVVVKWPQKVAALVKPHASIEGKTVRFDLYFAGLK